ncbi:MAG: ThiF family adenylyltransferase [Phycisphaerales bacterium]|jgi:adenylyltransferase/sulfurtransferase|nr:ThiF family adenylyltransferase [Phycisphaerales bacterium]
MTISDRYHRQRLISDIGDDGQGAICNGHIAIVGVGALGCSSADMLSRAGVGTITLIDRDIVEQTNLQRQLLYTEEDAKTHQPKAVAAKKRLQAINSSIIIHEFVEDLTARNIDRLLKGVDLIIDGLDNFNTRYVLNDYAVKNNIPFLFAGVIAGSGNAMTVIPNETPCLRCLFPEPPPIGSQETCDTAGVIAPAIGIAASCQCCDALKLLSGNRDKISKTLLVFDIWNTLSNRLDIGTPNESCQCCQENNFVFLETSDAPIAASLCGQNAVQLPSSGEIDLLRLASRLESHGSFSLTGPVLRGSLNEELSADGDPIVLLCFEDGRVIVHGTNDVGRAKAIHARFIGV